VSRAKVTRRGVCRFCKCTHERACEPPCSWIDKYHTVCSSPGCVIALAVALLGEAPKKNMATVLKLLSSVRRELRAEARR